jgi:hypothetical protein
MVDGDAQRMDGYFVGSQGTRCRSSLVALAFLDPHRG